MKVSTSAVCIYASQVASCIGHNRWKKPHEALEAVWQRLAPTSYEDALARNHVKTQETLVADLASANDSVRSLLVECESTKTQTTTSADVAKQYEKVSQDLMKDPDLDHTQRKLVDDVLKKNMYTSFGTRKEHDVLQSIAKTMIPCHTDDTFYKKEIACLHGVPIFLGGRIDALSDDGATVIEIKNRINRLFYQIPAYERIQVQCYLRLVPHAVKGLLVECLTKEDGDVILNAVDLTVDDDLWHDVILPKLKAFVSYLMHLLDTPDEQDAYLRHTRKAAFLTSRLRHHHQQNQSEDVDTVTLTEDPDK